MLKSKWLEGKYNRRFDYLVFTLTRSADPYYRFRHDKQQAGLEGLNLEASRRREIEEIAKTITRDSIEKFDDTQFHVASQTKSGHFYSINLVQPTCSCPDFPRIRFCKHIGAIHLHFPHVRPSHTPAAPPAPPAPPAPQRVPAQSTSSTFHSLVQDVNTLSHRLISDRTNDQALSPAVVEAVRSAKASLTTAIASVNGSSALPTKKRIAPNQHSWTETARAMGVKRVAKRRLPEEVGLTEKAIGPAKGKRRRVYTDPYAGGERPGRLAKPDAVSASANQQARERALPPSSQPTPAGPLPPTFPPLPATQPIPGSLFHPLPHPLSQAPAPPNSYPFPSTYAFPPAT